MQEIDCQSCGARVVADLKKQAGVYDATFDRTAAELSIDFDGGAVGAADFIAIVESHGYVGIEGAGQGKYIEEIEFDPALDFKRISDAGEYVALDANLVAGKVMVFDFYAVWCKPCRQVDHHMKQVLAASDDVALRKLNIVDWDSELAAKYMKEAPDLPYVVVYGADGKLVDKISGLDLEGLDAAIQKGRAP